MTSTRTIARGNRKRDILNDYIVSTTDSHPSVKCQVAPTRFINRECAYKHRGCMCLILYINNIIPQLM